MQFHLVYDPRDREYTILLKSGKTYYYNLSWYSSKAEALTKFNGFNLDPDKDVTNESLLTRMQTLVVFTNDSHPEYFL